MPTVATGRCTDLLWHARATASPGPVGLSWQRVRVDTEEQFRGLDAVDARTAWVGGSDG